MAEFNYADAPNVITQLEMEALAKAADGGAIKRLSDGKEVKNVVFVQCAGQGSSIDVQTAILFTDLRTPGAGGEDFY